MTRTHADIVELMSDAVDFSTRHVDDGGLPFVGVVLDSDGYVSSFGVNEVHQTGDQTAHAEIVAMRSALRDRPSADLAGTWLLATGEPCGLCCHFALERGVDRIYTAIDADVAAGWGFDYRHSYRTFAIDRGALRREGLVHQLPVPEGLEPFRRFDSRHRRIRTASIPTHKSTKRLETL